MVIAVTPESSFILGILPAILTKWLKDLRYILAVFPFYHFSNGSFITIATCADPSQNKESVVRKIRTEGNIMLIGRAAIYFDEVARRGGLRRAADVLHIAPSAVDRQIIQLEEYLGTKLFERIPTGMRMTAAGELLIDAVRRWRRDLLRVQSEIDNLVGLRRGQVSIAMVEGAVELVAYAIEIFQKNYPAIQFTLDVYGAQGVTDQVLATEVDFGITFNPPNNSALQLNRTLIYDLGIVMRPDHPLARKKSVTLIECAEYPQILPGQALSIKHVLDRAWSRNLGGLPRGIAEVGSIDMIKALALRGIGMGWLTSISALREILNGTLVFVPVEDQSIDLFNFSIISASGRILPQPASLMIHQLVQIMENKNIQAI